MKRYSKIISILLFVALDYLSIIAAEQSAFFIRNILFQASKLYISWLNFWLVFPVLYIFFINMNQLYTRCRPFYKEVEQLFYTSLYGTLAVILVLYILRIAGSTSRFFTGAFGIFAFVYLTLLRYALKNFLQRKQLLQKPVIIVGAGKTAELLVKSLNNDPGMGYKIVGLLEDNKVQDGILEQYPVLGGFADAERIIAETGVRRVFIAAPGLNDHDLGMLIYRIQPLVENMGVITNLVGVPTGTVEAESIFNEKLLILRLKNNLARTSNRFIKTIVDYTLTILGVILISPILLFIAAWIYKDSPGPVIFRHIRIGKNGKPFPCFKFRTMCNNADKKLQELLANDAEARAEWEKDFKLKNDPRITKSGAFLRKTSLDELPQLLNVLRGEMSLVGPRPVIEAELPRYGDFLDDYLIVKPGITGMWQVNGRSDTTYDERVQMDSWYVRNWSVWLDFMLLFRTVKAVLAGKGAY